MNAKVIVLLKRDLDYKLKQISNKDWEKKVWIFLGLSVRGNPDKTPLTPSSFADPLWFASLCWRPLLRSVFWSSSYFLLTLLFARYSPFYLCLFLFSFAFLSPYSAYFSVLSNFLARFSRLALRLLLVAFFDRFVSFFPAYFTQNPSPRTWIIRIFLRLTKL